jgi:hypothetical protein
MTPEMFVKCCAIANFVREHYVPARIWIDPVGWVQFHLMHGFTSTVYDGLKIVGFMVARPVDAPEDGFDTYKFKDESDCIFLDLLISPGEMPAPMSTFSRILEERYGKPKTLAYFRGLIPRLVVRDYDKFAENVRKKEGDHSG